MNRSFPLAVSSCVLCALVGSLLFAQSRNRGENYAFLVACSGYDKTELLTLPHTIDDIEEFRKALLETGFNDDNIKMMHDNQKQRRYLSEKDKILKELKLLLAGLKPEDTLVVAFSGHGVHFKGDKTGYLCPVDAKLSNKATLIPTEGDDGIFEILRKCPAKNKLLLVNACRNDPSSNTALAARKVDIDTVDTDVVPEGIAALYSCQAAQKSYFDPDRKRGIFFDHVIRGWRGEYTKDNPDATIEDFFNAVVRKTKSDVDKTYGEAQVPEIRREYKGEWKLAAKSAIVPPTPKPKESTKEIVSKTLPGLKLLRIPAGKFTMGSPKEEKDRYDSETQHEVTLTKDYYMGETHVTVGQWRAFQKATGHDAKAGDKPSFAQEDDHPVVNVSWEDAKAFCAWLSKEDGRKYRLPTEAEWEYACRAGTKTAYWYGDEADPAKANFSDSKIGGTTGVKKYKANGYGLYDMSGNAYQWCEDLYGKYQNDSQTNPVGPSEGSDRVLRGGSWYDDAGYCRSAYRDRYDPSYRSDFVGFRLAVPELAK